MSCIWILKYGSETHASLFPSFCLDSELQSPPSTLQEEFGLPYRDLPLKLPIWVSLKAQQEKVREDETQEHLLEVT